MADNGIQVIDRAFDILETLTMEKEGLGVTEIGNRIGLHKSTVHRILTTMVKRGYVEKNTYGLYKIGLKFIDISSIYLNNVELKTEAKPFLRELTNKYNQTTHLAILDGAEAVYIDKVDVLNNIRLYSQIGRRVPIHCSAIGKCLISGLTDVELESILNAYSFTSLTEKTIKNKKEYLEQIENVKRLKWSLDDEEHEAGVRCVAAPVFDYRGKIIAAVSISGSFTTITDEKLDEIINDVKATAMEISKRMGWK